MRPMLALLLAPAVLSALVLAAHFLRNGQWLPTLACLAMAALPAVRKSWVPRVLQFLLGIGVLVWARTLAGIARARIEHDQPWGRTAIILGAVAAVAALGAVALSHRRVARHYRNVGEAAKG